MQAHQLDLHRLWLTLLGFSALLFAGWAAWAFLGQVVIYEHSQSLQLGEQTFGDTILEERASVNVVRAPRQQWLQASFAEAAYNKLSPGQEATIFVRGSGSEQGVAAVTTEVRADCEYRRVQVMLRADLPADDPDPFAEATPSRVRVVVEKFAPISFFYRRRASSPAVFPCQHDDRNDNR